MSNKRLTVIIICAIAASWTWAQVVIHVFGPIALENS